MKINVKRSCVLLFVFLSASVALQAAAFAAQFQVGVSPAVLDLGEVGRGESKRGSFVITTNSDEGFVVNIGVARGSIDFFDGRYNYLLDEYSEEDASPWVNFLNAPVYLEPGPESAGTNVMKANQINFIVNVPEDAEPGYHLVEIIPKPDVPGGWSTGVNIVAITKINMLLRVRGEVERSGDVLDISARISGKRTMVDVFFQNTGSVSMFARADNIRLYDAEGNLLESIWSTKTFTEPGEVVKLSGFVTRAFEPGSYLASANVSFLTGHTAKETGFWLEAPSEPSAPGAPGAPGAAEFPWWILIVVILIVGYVIYRYV